MAAACRILAADLEDPIDGPRLRAPPLETVLRSEPAVLTPADTGELLTLQRAAFATEAQLYGDPWLPALVQTFVELRAELTTGRALGLRIGGRLVGAVRTREDAGVLHVNRLTVAPDLQGVGIGSRLLLAAEDGATASVAVLFTGHRSAGNLRLYERHGYVEQRREPAHAGLTLVHLSKLLRG